MTDKRGVDRERTGDVASDGDAARRFINIGERTNVTGSAKFRKLITAGDYAAAL